MRRWSSSWISSTCTERRTNAMAKRDAKVVWSSSDGDLRKARDPKVKARMAAGGRMKVRREVAGRSGSP
jgi:hypothetical protein